MKYTSNYNLKKPEGTDIVNIDDLNYNADILDQKLKEVENGVYNAPPNSVNDLAIGTLTPDESQIPASPGSGTLTQILSWLANRIKAITGKTHWWEEPPTTLQAAKNHIDAAAPHSGHETPSGAQAKVDAHANSKQTHGISDSYYIAKTSRSDQLPAWGDIQGKPDLASAAQVQAHVSDNVRHITASERTAWNNKLDASAYTAEDVLAKIKTVDGDGSGLDADTLDGFHASAFALAGHTTHIGEQLSPQQNGYFKMANGLILQWGRALCNKGNNISNVNILFPITFPTACLAISTTFDNRPNDAWDALTTAARNITKQGCILSGDTTQEDKKIFNDVYIYYIAIGY